MELSHMTRCAGVLDPGLNRAAPDRGEMVPEACELSGNPVEGAKALPGFQPVAERFSALEEQEIILAFFAPEATAVAVAGGFNGWCPDVTPMKEVGEGEWAVHLPLRSGRYEYRFVVDGQWYEDPRAAQRSACPYGGFNSVLQVPLAVRTSIL